MEVSWKVHSFFFSS